MRCATVLAGQSTPVTSETRQAREVPGARPSTKQFAYETARSFNDRPDWRRQRDAHDDLSEFIRLLAGHFARCRAYRPVCL